MGRAPCCDKNGLKKGPWTPEEDLKLTDYIQKHGYGNWRTLPKNAGLQRCGKSCRLRWTNYLRPDIKRGRFSFEEEETIIQLHSILGNKWSAIAGRLPGRTDNEIKNYWNTHIRKRLLRMGIDPVTHSPRLDLLDLSSIISSSLYNSSQINISRLLGVHPTLVNPELMRLATSLMSSQRDQNQNQNYHAHQNVQHHQHHQINQICNQQEAEQFQYQQQQQIMDHHPEVVEQFQTNFSNFTNQNDHWQSNEMPSSNLTQEDYVPIPTSHYSYYGGSCNNSDQTVVMDPSISSVTNSNNNFSFASVLSTPSSSPTPLHSNSTTYNISTEDHEIESYCSEMLKFEIQDILDDVGEFM
ncbi:hypothetical protein EZV62_026565 [Acer yangbiense]|uniref:Uncharacterized protein n=1 Tax=Acer yangbiense TaxID=1000413 RepID=A0A5C7GR34_9ROSI|nr:hypothetical protein EZV62_026565 [Acer yangbiense]